MSVGFQVGDAIALAKIAVDLYQNVFLVAKAAPETFNKLLRELIIVKNVLYKIDYRYKNANRRYFDEATQGALYGAREALLTFRPLVIKYKKLASANGSQLRQKLKFPFDQKKIAKAREELQKSINTLNLAISVDAAFGPFDDDPSYPPQRSRQATVEDASDDLSTLPGRLGSTRLLQGQADRNNSIEGYPWGLNRVQTLESSAMTVPNAPEHRRNDTVTSVPEPSYLAPLAQNTTHSSSHHSAESQASIRSGHSRSSLGSHASAGARNTQITIPSPQSPREPIFRADYTLTPDRPRTVPDDDEHSIHEREEQILIDMDYKAEIYERLNEHTTFQSLETLLCSEAAVFQEQAPDLNKWLECALWWLLKARKITQAIHTDSDTREQRRIDWSIRVSPEQATVDMFKACWICKNIMFASENDNKIVPGSTWKMCKDLASAVYDELQFCDILQELASDVSLQKLYLGFSERIHQPVESEERLPAALDSLQSASRWLTVDLDHAGDIDERVLLRTWVNAQIGSQRNRRKSPTAPYMLLLWSQHGRSEVLLSLANQLGTVNLCCTLTELDLKRHDEHTVSSLAFEVNFPSQECIVQFLNPQELQEFLDQPRSFFEATKEREAKPEEFLCFREGLKSFNERAHRNRASISGAEVTQAHSSCEVSLYGLIPDQCWKTQRRLVISSALDARQPRCVSYWLPMGGVRVQGQGCDVELLWSDCNQLETRSDGFYGHYYSLIHDQSNPNLNINLQFQTPESADEFKATILRPFNLDFETDSLEFKGSFGTAGGPNDHSAPVGQELSIYQVMDGSHAGKQMYLSIVHTERHAQMGFSSTVYFVHRDIDFLIERSGEHSISFEGLWAPKYISNFVNAKAPPKDVVGRCVDVEWKFSQADFHFSPGEIPKFMATLIGWDLVFSCTAQSLALSTSITATKQKGIILSLWKRSGSSDAQRELRLTARWLGEAHSRSEHRWTTGLITTSSTCIANSTKIVLKGVDLSRGTQLDIKPLTAVDAHGRFQQQHNKTIVLTLPDPGAAQSLSSHVGRNLHPMIADQDPVLWRP